MRDFPFAPLVAILLLTVIGLHVIGVEHSHPHELFGDDPYQAAMHNTDRKWLLAMLCLAAVASFFFPTPSMRALGLAAYASAASLERALISAPIRLALARGIVHGKAF